MKRYNKFYWNCYNFFVISFIFLCSIINCQDNFENQIFDNSTTIENYNTEAEYSYHEPVSLNHSMEVFIDSIYNETENIIQLNISWTENEQVTELIDFHIQDIICKYTKNPYSKMVSVNDQSTISSILLPEDSSMLFQVHPSCVYAITINAKYDKYTIHYQKDFNYTVPDCVGELCNCSKFQPKQHTLTTKQISDEEFLVKWNLETINSISINTLTFDLANGTHHVPTDYIYLKSLDWKSFNLSHGEITLNIPKSLYVEGGNELSATFLTNKSNCEYRYEISFNATKNFTSTLFILVIFLLVGLFVLTIAFWFYKKRQKKLKDNFTLHINDNINNTYTAIPTLTCRKQSNINELYVDQEIQENNTDKFEFPTSRLQLLNEIGKGAFGEVFLGRAFQIQGTKGYTNVAVKRLRSGAPPEEVDDFICEINILKRIPEHQHIVSLFGSCTLREPYMMIMEFVPCGDLRNYLLELRKQWQNKRMKLNSESTTQESICDYVSQDSVPLNWQPNYNYGGNNSITTETSEVASNSTGYTTLSEAMSMCNKSTYVPVPLHLLLDPAELQSFSLQIAKGMEHLEKIPITHRDLAARNILINEFKVLKISDFGLSRSGPYVNRNMKKIPLRWNAIEAIDSQFYDSKSDVWSFGVVLWEIGTLGAFPYERIPDNLLLHSLLNGERLERPAVCSDALYTLMLRCWSMDARMRPTFAELVDLLEVTADGAAKRVYIDFGEISAGYVFPPAKLVRRNSRNYDPSETQTP